MTLRERSIRGGAANPQRRHGGTRARGCRARSTCAASALHGVRGVPHCTACRCPACIMASMLRPACPGRSPVCILYRHVCSTGAVYLRFKVRASTMSVTAPVAAVAVRPGSRPRGDRTRHRTRESRWSRRARRVTASMAVTACHRDGDHCGRGRGYRGRYVITCVGIS